MSFSAGLEPLDNDNTNFAFLWTSLMLAIRAKYVISGCAVTEESPTPDLTVDVSAGYVWCNDQKYTVSGSNIDLSAIHTALGAGKAKYVFITYLAGTGLTTIEGVEGDPGAHFPPQFNDSEQVLLARILLTKTDSAINTADIDDLRHFAPKGGYLDGNVEITGDLKTAGTLEVTGATALNGAVASKTITLATGEDLKFAEGADKLTLEAPTLSANRTVSLADESGTIALLNNIAADSAVAANTTHRSSDGKNHADVVLNNTHRGSDGKNHADVVLNNTHRSSSGVDHSDVVLNTTHRGSDGKNHADVVLNNTHRGSDGKNHADVVLNNTHRSSSGVNHSYINQPVTTSASPSFSGVNTDTVSEKTPGLGITLDGVKLKDGVADQYVIYNETKLQPGNLSNKMNDSTGASGDQTALQDWSGLTCKSEIVDSDILSFTMTTVSGNVGDNGKTVDGYFEISIDGGGTWTKVDTGGGNSYLSRTTVNFSITPQISYTTVTWADIQNAMPSLSGTQIIKIRLRLDMSAAFTDTSTSLVISGVDYVDVQEHHKLIAA